MGRDQTKGPSNADRGHSLLSPVTPRGGSVSDSVEEKEGTGFECRGRDQMTDWNGIRSEALGKGIVPEAFRVIVSDRGPEWVPPDPGGVTRLVEFMDKRGLKSPLTLNALQTLAALGPLFPRDITNLMRMVLRLVQYTLWETDWMAELGGACRGGRGRSGPLPAWDRHPAAFREGRGSGFAPGPVSETKTRGANSSHRCNGGSV